MTAIRTWGGMVEAEGPGCFAKVTRDQILAAFVRWREGESIAALAREHRVSRHGMRSKLLHVDRLVRQSRATGDGALLLRWASQLPRLPRAATRAERDAWTAVVADAHAREDALEVAARQRTLRRRNAAAARAGAGLTDSETDTTPGTPARR